MVIAGGGVEVGEGISGDGKNKIKFKQYFYDTRRTFRKDNF